MNGVIGEILPLALGVAISPVPIIAAILMLLAPKARSASVGFLIGWLVGILVAVSVFYLLAAILPESSDDTAKPVAGTIKIVLGILLVLLAIRQWRHRPAAGETAALPKWMSAIDTMSVGRALGLGALLSGVNPKNLLLAAGAGLAIGSGGLDAGPAVLVIVIFTVIGGASVAVPVIAYLLASKQMAAPLESLRAWLAQNNAVVMAVLLLVIGVVVIGKGIANF